MVGLSAVNINSDRRDYQDEVRTLATGGAIGILGRLATQFLLVASAPVLARLLGAQAFGTFSIARESILLLSIFLLGGIPQAIIRHGAMAIGDRAPIVRDTVFTVSAILFASNLVICLIIMSWSKEIGLALFHTESIAPVLRIMALSLPFLALGRTLSEATLALRTVSYLVMGELSRVAAFFALLLLFCGLLTMALTGAALAFVMASGIFSLVASIGSLKCFGYPSLHNRPTKELVDVFSFSIPVLIVSLTDYGLFRLNILIGGSLLAETEIGVYSAACRLSAVCAFGLYIMGSIYRPIIADLHARGDLNLLRMTFCAATRWVYYLTVPVCLFLFFKAETIVLLLFGGQFLEGSRLLRILCIGQLINCLTGNVGLVLTMAGRPWVQAGVNVAMVVVNLLLCLFLTPKFGTTALAVAAAGSMGTANIVKLLLARRYFGIALTSWKTTRALILIILSCPLLYFRIGAGLTDMFVSLFLFLGLLGILWWFVGIEEEDKYFLTRTFLGKNGPYHYDA